jgi:segregation and condensation protein A
VRVPPVTAPGGTDSAFIDLAAPGDVDPVALARLYGEPLFALPNDLYIPPEALQSSSMPSRAP